MHVNLESRLKENLSDGVYHKFLSDTKSSKDSSNGSIRIPFMSCMGKLPFLKDHFHHNRWTPSLSIIIHELKSNDVNFLSPSGLLEYYHKHCYCK